MKWMGVYCCGAAKDDYGDRGALRYVECDSAVDSSVETSD